MEQTKSGETEGTYRIRPDAGQEFKVSEVKSIITDVMQHVLDGQEYSQKHAARWSKQIVNEINQRLRELEVTQHKHVVQVMLMEQTGAGCRYMARCRWDASCDNQISEVYKSKTMSCIVSVYTIYHY